MVRNDYLILLNEKKIYLFIIFRSDDGRILIASSTDGYCSIIHFQKGELGQEYKKQSNIPTKSDSINNNFKQFTTSSFNIKNVSEKLAATADIDNSAIDIDIKHEIKKILNENSQNIINENNKLLNHTIKQKTDLDNKMEIEETEDIKLVYNEESTNEVKVNISQKSEVPLIIPSKTPRRVQLITLSSPKGLKKEQS